MGSGPWWEAGKDDLAKRIFATVAGIDDRQGDQADDLGLYLGLYGNFDSLGKYGGRRLSSMLEPGKLRLNVIKAAVDTVTAKIAKAQPKATFITDGGKRDLQQRARLLERFVLGQFDQAQVYRKTPKAFRDGAIFGTGALKITPNPTRIGHITVDRVFREELLVDDTEAVFGEPRQLMQRRAVSPDVLKAAYPRAKDEIDRADRAKFAFNNSYLDTDMVSVVEAWHLPSGHEAKDGRHTISISTAVLFDEKWTQSTFPFSFVHWNEPARGYWGTGIPEELLGIQVAINEALEVIQEALTFSVPRLLVPANSKMSQVTDVVMSHITYTGSIPPQLLAWDTVPREQFAHLQDLVRKAFEFVGISQLTAQSQLPKGLEGSGEAIRTFHDIETERFIMAAKAYESFHIDTARHLIRIAKKMDADIREARKRGEDVPDYTVTAIGKKAIEKLRWRDVEIDETDYFMAAYPTNFLPDRPEGKQAALDRWLQMGVITLDRARQLADLPDLDADRSLYEADRDYTLHQIDRMLDHGEAQTPEPFQGLEQAIDLATRSYFEAKKMGVAEGRLRLVREYIDAAKATIRDLARQEQQTISVPPVAGVAAGPGGPVPPDAGAAPAPDILPNGAPPALA